MILKNSKWWISQANKKTKFKTTGKVNEPDNIDGANVEKFVIESEADKFFLLFEKVFKEKHIEEESITDYLDAEGGAFQDILEKIANKISEKIEIAASENKSIKLLQLLNFFFKSFVTPCHAKNRSSSAENAEE